METLQNQEGEQTLNEALKGAGLTGNETRYLICVLPEGSDQIMLAASGTNREQIGMLVTAARVMGEIHADHSGETEQ
jgi:hypothetical protein